MGSWKIKYNEEHLLTEIQKQSEISIQLLILTDGLLLYSYDHPLKMNLQTSIIIRNNIPIAGAGCR